MKAKTRTEREIIKGIKNGTYKNLVKCARCGLYHRRDAACPSVPKSR